MGRAFTSLLAVVVLVSAGCAGMGESATPDPTAPSFAEVRPPPVTPQLLEVMPALKSQRFSPLLDFETDPDGVFVAMKPAGVMVYDRAHTGKRSLRIAPGTQRIAIKLGALLSGRPFPADWTLVGAFLYCDQPIEVMIGIEGADGANVAPRKVPLTPGKWTSAFVEVKGDGNLPAAVSRSATLVISFPSRAPTVWCDDVLLINNTQTLVDGRSPAPTTAPAAETTGSPAVSGLSIQRRGLHLVGEAPGKFNFQLVTADASKSGWRVEEANALRARFTSDGSTKYLTVYRDGRSFWDAQLRAMSVEVRDNPAFAEQHASPAQIVVPEELGRVDRNSAGDANNDGYNERSGAYRIIANGPRMELKLMPQSAALFRPVLEVQGLPPGKVLVTVEGRLIEQVLRGEDGAVLVELPLRMDRPTTVNLRVQ